MAAALRAALALAALAAAAAAAPPPYPAAPAPPPQPSVMLPDESDGGATYLSLLLQGQAHALAAAAPSDHPLAAALADVGKLLLTLHDAAPGKAGGSFEAPPLAALFAKDVNGTQVDAALGVADKVLTELSEADWLEPKLSGRLAHAMGLEDLFFDKQAAPAPPPPPRPTPPDQWPSKGQAVVDALNDTPAAQALAAAADDKVAATQAEYEAELAAAAEKGAAWQAGRITVAGTGIDNGTALQDLERAKLPALPQNPNKTLKGYPLPRPRKQVVDLYKPGDNATLEASERHLNLTKAAFPVAPPGSDLLGLPIDVLTADPLGSALAPALANPVGRDPKLGNPIASYTTTSTFGVGQGERKLVDNPQSLDPDILRVFRTVDIFNFASTMMVYRPCVVQVYENLASAWISGIKVSPDLIGVSAFGAKITPTLIDIAPGLKGGKGEGVGVGVGAGSRAHAPLPLTPTPTPPFPLLFQPSSVSAPTAPN